MGYVLEVVICKHVPWLLESVMLTPNFLKDRGNGLWVGLQLQIDRVVQSDYYRRTILCLQDNDTLDAVAKPMSQI